MMLSIPLHDVNEIKPALAAAGLDAAIAISPRNVWCLSAYPRWRRERPGYRRSAVVIAYPEADATLVTGRYQEEISLIRAWARDITSFADYVESPLGRAAEVLRRRRLGSGRIGIEARFLTANFAADLEAGLEGAEIVACDDLFASTWGVKQPAELDVMRHNVEKLAAIVQSVLVDTHPGETEASLHKRMLSAIRLAGTGEGWGRTIAGERLAIGGALPSDRPLQKGDLVNIEYACAYRTYPVKIGRMVVVGEPSDEQQARYERYVQAVKRLVQQVGPDQSGEEIFELSQEMLREAGLQVRGSTVGEAIGIGYYERPSLEVGEKLRTRAGMVLCIEPETTDGIKLSQEVLITDTGATPWPDRLAPTEQFLSIRS